MNQEQKNRKAAVKIIKVEQAKKGVTERTFYRRLGRGFYENVIKAMLKTEVKPPREQEPVKDLWANVKGEFI